MLNTQCIPMIKLHHDKSQVIVFGLFWFGLWNPMTLQKSVYRTLWTIFILMIVVVFIVLFFFLTSFIVLHRMDVCRTRGRSFFPPLPISWLILWIFFSIGIYVIELVHCMCCLLHSDIFFFFAFHFHFIQSTNNLLNVERFTIVLNEKKKHRRKENNFHFAV